MKIDYTSIILLLISLLVMSCGETENSKKVMSVNPVMVVTTFKISNEVSADMFNKRDEDVSSDFTSKQPGFIKRLSGVTAEGEIGVVVFWRSLTDADQSMKKFMNDQSVSDYSAMIDASSMKLTRFVMDQSFNDKQSDFIELMTFDLNADAKATEFNEINDRVAKEVTGPKPGFIQRLSGKNEEGKQVVAVFWDNKKNSDAALKPFMESPISKNFMGMMNQSTIWMGRYQTLSSLSKN